MSATPFRRRLFVALLAFLLVATAVLPVTAAERDEDAERDALRGFFTGLTPLEPIQVGPLTVIPLRAAVDASSTKVLGHPTLLEATVKDPSAKKPRLELRNPSSRAVLVTAGRVAYTATSEAILAHDVVVPAKGTAIARALPGAFDGNRLLTGQPLSWYPRWAPPSLRESIVTDPSSYDVKHFLSLFHAVAGEDRDRIPSLRDVLSSDFAKSLDAHVAEVMHDERFRGERVVGFVSGLHGHVVALQLFGSAELHRKNAAALLVSHGIYASALEARAKELGIRLRSGSQASDVLLTATRDLLYTMRLKSRKEAKIDAGITGIYGPGVLGRATWYGGHPVHVAAYPHDPHQRALFARSFEPRPKAVPAAN